MKRLRGTAVVRLLTVVLSLCLQPEVNAQSQRQQLVAAAVHGCASSESQLEKAQLPNLRRKQTALRILVTDWQEKTPAHLKENMPAQLQEGLNVEIAALKVLFDISEPMKNLFKACEGLTEATDVQTITQLENLTNQADETLKQWQERWKRSPEKRKNFKDSLEKAIGLLQQYNPAKINTYIQVKIELDPDNLDLVFVAQRSLLLPVSIAASVLK